MTLPRQVVPGATIFMTRRILRRHHLLRPDPEMNRIVTYALAAGAKRYDIAVHAVTVMSTHVHMVLTDQVGNYPEFLAFFHRLVALMTKVHRKWEGPVWDHEQTSIVHLTTEESVIEKIAYTLANPVAAGLVRTVSEWPGVCAAAKGRSVRCLAARRPEGYLDPKNPQWSDDARVELSPPACLIQRRSPLAVEALIDAEVERLERAAHTRMRRNGWQFMGARGIRRVPPTRRAVSFRPLRNLNPTFAIGRGMREAFLAAVRSLREFRAAYRLAYEQWRSGVRSARFPAGSWEVVRYHGAKTDAP